MSNTFQMGHCEGCIQYKTEKRILLECIEGYKRVIDKIINSDSYPLSDDLMIISMEMERNKIGGSFDVGL